MARALGVAAMCVLALAGCAKSEAATPPPDPAAIAAKAEAARLQQKAAAAAREKGAVDAFPVKRAEITSSLKKATRAADTAKWAQADLELSTIEVGLQDFLGTSVADAKEFKDLAAKAVSLRKRIDPPMYKIRAAELKNEARAAAAAEEKQLKASAVVVSNAQLFADYQANEVAADNKYKGKKILVSGAVASIDKGLFGGAYIQLSTGQMFSATRCDMDDSEKSQLAGMRKGQSVRVLCTGIGMGVNVPLLDDCVFR